MQKETSQNVIGLAWMTDLQLGRCEGTAGDGRRMADSCGYTIASRAIKASYCCTLVPALTLLVDLLFAGKISAPSWSFFYMSPQSKAPLILTNYLSLMLISRDFSVAHH